MTAPTAPLQLSAQQQAVVSHRGGPLLVLAGPGTGKTATIAEAVAARNEQESGRCLVLTFGRAAALELRDRIARRIGQGPLPVVTTFHSFAYQLMSQYAPEGLAFSPRLLTAPEQESRLRELLTHAIREGRVPWPAELDPAVGTIGLAAQVADLIARCQTLGISATELNSLGQGLSRPTWKSVATFMNEYLDVLEYEAAIDYTTLMTRAANLAEHELRAGKDELRRRFSTIYVDEYQDTDPAQVRLLQAIASPTTTLVVVGDPDQAIYRFRGADVGGILRFREQFRTRSGAEAPVVVLGHTRRFGPTIRDAAGQVIAPVGLGSLPVEVQKNHRGLECVSDSNGVVDVRTFDSESAEANFVADLIRRSVLSGDVKGWSDCAVLLRSAVHAMPAIVQALVTANVPVTVPDDDVPLAWQPSVRALLAIVRAAVLPDHIDPDAARGVVMGPLARVNAVQLRGLMRELRRSPDLHDNRTRSDAALVHALRNPKLTQDLPGDAARSVHRAAVELQQIREHHRRGSSAYSVLWEAWTAGDWPERLHRAAMGGGRDARAAHRDLDAICGLFAQAARADREFGGKRDIASFLHDLEAAVFNATSDRGASSTTDAVTVTTAHRAKGLQWPLVVVAGVQEEVWPDVRYRATLLQSDQLGADGSVAGASVRELLADERRLMYVACTRAQQRLVVTAVQSPSDAGQRASRFIDEIAQEPAVVRQHQAGAPAAALSTSSMVARLRAVLEAPEGTDASPSPAVRTAAAHQLARLAAAGVRAAQPDSWWSMFDRSQSERALYDPDQPIYFSGSMWSSLSECSLRWFLDRQVKASRPRGSAVAFGSVVHALAEAVANDELPPDPEVLAERAREIWPAVGYDAAWHAQRELNAAAEACARFVAWHTAMRGRTLVAVEQEYEQDVQLGEVTLRLRGYLDRIEVDAAGKLHVVDLKTERKAKTPKEIASHEQLTLYQLAGTLGGYNQALGVSQTPPVAGAELVQLRIPNKASELPLVQVQSAIDPAEVLEKLDEAVEPLLREDFAARPSEFLCGYCDFRFSCPAQSEGQEVPS